MVITGNDRMGIKYIVYLFHSSEPQKLQSQVHHVNVALRILQSSSGRITFEQYIRMYIRTELR